MWLQLPLILLLFPGISAEKDKKNEDGVLNRPQIDVPLFVTPDPTGGDGEPAKMKTKSSSTPETTPASTTKYEDIITICGKKRKLQPCKDKAVGFNYNNVTKQCEAATECPNGAWRNKQQCETNCEVKSQVTEETTPTYLERCGPMRDASCTGGAGAAVVGNTCRRVLKCAQFETIVRCREQCPFEPPLPLGACLADLSSGTCTKEGWVVEDGACVTAARCGEMFDSEKECLENCSAFISVKPVSAACLSEETGNGCSLTDGWSVVDGRCVKKRRCGALPSKKDCEKICSQQLKKETHREIPNMERLVNTRFWKHYSSTRARTSSECAERCLASSSCGAATFDHNNQAHAEYNCHFFKLGTFTETPSEGFTSYKKRSQDKRAKKEKELKVVATATTSSELFAGMESLLQTVGEVSPPLRPTTEVSPPPRPPIFQNVSEILEISRNFKKGVNNVKSSDVTKDKEQKKNDTKQIAKLTVQLSSMYLTAVASDTKWNENSADVKAAAATRTSEGLDQAGFELADTLSPEETETIYNGDVYLEVTKVASGSRDRSADLNFPSQNGNNKKTVQVKLPVKNAEEGTEPVPVVFTLLGGGMNNSLRHNSSTPAAISSVFGLSIGTTDAESTQLQQNVTFTLGHEKVAEGGTTRCAWWYSREDTYEWRTTGCVVMTTNSTTTSCSCNHLTSFAIIFDTSGLHESFSEEDIFNLEIVSVIGLSVSIIAAFLFLLILVFVRNQREKVTMRVIYINKVSCLLFSYGTFLGGINQTQNKDVCRAVAVLLQFSFVSLFSWMLIAAIDVFLILAQVVSPLSVRDQRWLVYLLFGYTPSGILVFITYFVSDGAAFGVFEGNYQHCWVAPEYSWFVVGPIAAILLGNLLILSFATFKVFFAATASVSTNKDTESRLFKRNVKGIFFWVFLFGLTWITGFLYVSEDTVFMAYLFCVLGTLHGLFIFLFYCVFNPQMQENYLHFCRKNDWLPACLRDPAIDKWSSGYKNSNFSTNSSCDNQVKKTEPLPLYAGSISSDRYIDPEDKTSIKSGSCCEENNNNNDGEEEIRSTHRDNNNNETISTPPDNNNNNNVSVPHCAGVSDGSDTSAVALLRNHPSAPPPLLFTSL